MTVGTGVYHSISPPFVCILGKIFSAKGASGMASEPLLQAGNVESMRTQKFINLILRLKLNHANWAILLIIRASALKYWNFSIVLELVTCEKNGSLFFFIKKYHCFRNFFPSTLTPKNLIFAKNGRTYVYNKCVSSYHLFS